MTDWFLAIGLVGSSFCYVFYLGTRWGRYTSDPTPSEPHGDAEAPVKSWEMTRRRSPDASIDIGMMER